MEAKYSCIDEQHNIWKCENCGYMTSFEADGPEENGWDCCHSCGEKIRHGEE